MLTISPLLGCPLSARCCSAGGLTAADALQTQELLLDVPWGPSVLSLRSCKVAVSDTHEVRLGGRSSSVAAGTC